MARHTKPFYVERPRVVVVVSVNFCLAAAARLPYKVTTQNRFMNLLARKILLRILVSHPLILGLDAFFTGFALTPSPDLGAALVRVSASNSSIARTLGSPVVA